MAAARSRLLLLSSLLFSFLFHCVSADVASNCSALATLLPGKVWYPADQAYQNSMASYFFLGERLNPGCVVIPTSAQDVSVAVAQLTSMKTIFAVRSGGHSPNPGSANTNLGVTIDLQSLNTITVSSDSLTTYVGAGARWNDVYGVLDPRNLSVTGSRAGDPGVAGFLTGGGNSAFSPQRGWGCDGVSNFQVVLANGTIVNANASANADLFAALKGGQNNFGVITRADLITFAQGPYWGGAIQYTRAADDAQLAAFAEFKKPANFDPFAEIEQSYLYLGGTTFISSNNMFYSKPTVNASGLRFFTNIPNQIINTMRIAKAGSFASEIDAYQPQSNFGIYATSTFSCSINILRTVLSLWTNTANNQLARVNGITSVITFQSIPPIPASATPNSFGFAAGSAPEKNLVLVLVSNYWPLAADSTTVQTATAQLIANIDSAAVGQGNSHPFKYINYAATTASQNPTGSYGTASVAQLKAMSTKYDPSGVFQKQVIGGFKLPP